MTNNRLLPRFLSIATGLMMMIVSVSCIEDGVSSSPADQPLFSTDTLRMGQLFSDEGSPTRSFKVYNPHDKIIEISRVAMSGPDASAFRINVDGESGREISNVEVRPNDSIYVFVAVTPPATGNLLPIDVEASVDFTVNGVTNSVIVTAESQDVTRMRQVTLTADERWTATELPRVVYDSLVIAPGVTLTLDPGVRIYFHDKSRLVIRGTLISQGTPEQPVDLTGDRRGSVVADIPFDLMANQWDGVVFTSTSRSNRLMHTSIRNTVNGVLVDSLTASPSPAIELINCKLRNSAGNALAVRHSTLHAIGCEFAEAGGGAVHLHGGDHRFAHCTFANYYLFSYIYGPLIALSHVDAESDDGSGLPYTSARVTNSILYGMSAELSHPNLDTTAVYFDRCLMRAAGTDDEHFMQMIWGEDPLFYTVREDYIFDYSVKPESPVIGAAYSVLDDDLTLPATDWNGTPWRFPSAIGAFEYVDPE